MPARTREAEAWICGLESQFWRVLLSRTNSNTPEPCWGAPGGGRQPHAGLRSLPRKPAARSPRPQLDSWRPGEAPPVRTPALRAEHGYPNALPQPSAQTCPQRGAAPRGTRPFPGTHPPCQGPARAQKRQIKVTRRSPKPAAKRWVSSRAQPPCRSRSTPPDPHLSSPAAPGPISAGSRAAPRPNTQHVPSGAPAPCRPAGDNS